MSRASIFTFLILTLLSGACTKREPQAVDNRPSVGIVNTLPSVATQKAIAEMFPGAAPASRFSDSLFRELSRRYGITAKDILVGASTCVDDIIFTKDFHRHPEILGPFHMGGLGGLPFAGVSGFNAFSHHVPEGGTMILFLGPHIGYSEEAGWGTVLRPGQHHPTSCCGALTGTLAALQKGDIKPMVPDEDDYEGGKINQFALAHSKEILQSPNPVVTFVKLTSEEVETQILRFLPRVEMDHAKMLIVITGVLINTDYEYVDYWSTTHCSIYDVKSKTFLKN